MAETVPPKKPKRKSAEAERRHAPLRVGQFEKLIGEELKQEVKEAAALIVRPPGRPKGQPAFVKVQRAKEMLAKQSEMMVRLLGKAAKVAAEKGDSAPIEFALKHAATTDDQGKTVRPIETSIDKLESANGNRAPIINIGWVTPAAPALPTIEVLPLPKPSE